MATGGVETDVATGQPQVPDLPSPTAAQAAALEAQAAPGQVGTQMVGGEVVDPTAGQMQRNQRMTSSIPSFDMRGLGGRYSNADFYGQNPERPAQYSSESVGRYGASPIFIPDYGRAPMAVLAGRQAQIDADKKALQAQIDAFSPEAQLTKVKPPAYQKSWQDTINNTLYGKLDEVVAYYGGDKTAAYKALMDPREARKLGWTQTIEDINRTSELVNANYDNALGYIAAVDSNAVQRDPEMYSRAMAVRDALGNFSPSGNNWRELGKKVESFDAMMSLEKYISDYKIMDQLKNGFEQSVLGGKMQRDPKSGWWTLPQGKKKEWDSAIDQVADNISSFYNGYGGLTREVVKAKLDGLFPVQEEVKVTAYQPRAAKGGSKKEKEPEPTGAWGYGAGMSARGFGKFNDSKKQPVDVYHVELAKKAPEEFTLPGGAKVVGTPIRIELRGDKWYMLYRESATKKTASYTKSAKEQAQSDVSGVSQDMAQQAQSSGIGESAKESMVSAEGVVRAVPLKDVAARLKVMYGTSDPYQLSGDPSGMSMAVALDRYNKANKGTYTMEDVMSWPEDVRQNLISGYAPR